MNHYQKLAVLAFRVIAGILMLIGLVSGIVGLAVSLSLGGIAVLVSLVYSLPATILGIVLFALSRPMSRLICYDFDELSGS